MQQNDTSFGRVISLFLRRPAETECFAAVETYWHSLCDGRMMPLRSEIDPRGLVGALDRTFLLERAAPGVARFRLAGHHLSDLMGMEVRGMPLSCFFLPSARAGIADAVEAVFAEPARVDLWLEGPGRLARGTMKARMLLLPLRDRHGQVTRALGCLSASPPSGGAPHRFSITSDMRRTLVGYGKRPVPLPVAAPQAIVPGLKTRARPRLTLIQGGA